MAWVVPPLQTCPEVFWPVETHLTMTPTFETKKAALMISESPLESFFKRRILHVSRRITPWSLLVKYRKSNNFPNTFQIPSCLLLHQFWLSVFLWGWLIKSEVHTYTNPLIKGWLGHIHSVPFRTNFLNFFAKWWDRNFLNLKFLFPLWLIVTSLSNFSSHIYYMYSREVNLYFEHFV